MVTDETPPDTHRAPTVFEIRSFGREDEGGREYPF